MMPQFTRHWFPGSSIHPGRYHWTLNWTSMNANTGVVDANTAPATKLRETSVKYGERQTASGGTPNEQTKKKRPNPLSLNSACNGMRPIHVIAAMVASARIFSRQMRARENGWESRRLWVLLSNSWPNEAAAIKIQPAK